MTLTIEIPDERAVAFRREATTQGLSMDRWLLGLAEQCVPVAPLSPSGRTLVEVCARIRGLADDIDFSRDPSPGRDPVL